LVQRLLNQRVPIDGMGFQTHLIAGQYPSSMQQNLQRFANLGLDVAITEADVRINLPTDSSKLQTQANDFRQTVEVCLAVSRCTSYTAWGFTDRHSWIPDVFDGQGAATLMDTNLNPKPAYNAVLQALQLAGRSGAGRACRPARTSITIVQALSDHSMCSCRSPGRHAMPRPVTWPIDTVVTNPQT